MRFFIKAILVVVLCFYLLVLSKLILLKYLTIPDIVNHFTLVMMVVPGIATLFLLKR